MADNANAGNLITIKPWVLIVPLVLVALFFLPVAAVLGVGMIPTVVARVVDTSPGKRLSITVGAMNLVGCLYFVHRIMALGFGVEDISTTLQDSFGWFFALVGAGAGWVIFGFMPVIVAQIARAQTAVRLRRITGDQDRLVEEWGEAVRGVYGVRATDEKPSGQ